jgi:hypothetical protein
MNDKTPEQVVSDLWRSQEADAPRMTVELVRNRAVEHSHRIRRGNVLQCLTISIAVASLLWYVWQAQMLAVRLGLFLVLAFVAHSSIKWYRQASVEAPPAEPGVLSALAHYRKQLERQREARKVSPTFWLGGLFAAAAFDTLLTYEADKPWSALRFFTVMGVTAISLGVYLWFESRERRRLEAEIQALDSLKH